MQRQIDLLRGLVEGVQKHGEQAALELKQDRDVKVTQLTEDDDIEAYSGGALVVQVGSSISRQGLRGNATLWPHLPTSFPSARSPCAPVFLSILCQVEYPLPLSP